MNGESEAGKETNKEEGDNATNAARSLGLAPAVAMQKILKPRGDDLRELVLPGGGDLCLRV